MARILFYDFSTFNVLPFVIKKKEEKEKRRKRQKERRKKEPKGEKANSLGFGATFKILRVGRNFDRNPALLCRTRITVYRSFLSVLQLRKSSGRAVLYTLPHYALCCLRILRYSRSLRRDGRFQRASPSLVRNLRIDLALRCGSFPLQALRKSLRYS